MKSKRKISILNSWSDIKDRVYGKKGTMRRDDIERDSEVFKSAVSTKHR